MRRTGESGLVSAVVASTLLSVCGTGEPSQVITATVGSAVVLPCYLATGADASDVVVEWSRPDLSPDFIHVRRDREEAMDFKQPSYRGRTALSTVGLEHGDASLQISDVRLSDAGTYRCLVPSLDQDSFVQLVVVSVATPVIKVISDDSEEALVLGCQSGGWYPEPELLWLDSEGLLLSAEPAETVRGADGLYTVSSRVTVEKSRSNKYTCRVQQRDPGHTRDAHITVKYILVTESCSCCRCAVAFICIFTCSVFILYRCKYKRKHH